MWGLHGVLQLGIGFHDLFFVQKKPAKKRKKIEKVRSGHSILWLGCEYSHPGTSTYAQSYLSHCPWVQKVQILFHEVGFESPHRLMIPHPEPAFIEWQCIIYQSLPLFNMLGQKPKATNKVTLQATENCPGNEKANIPNYSKLKKIPCFVMIYHTKHLTCFM